MCDAEQVLMPEGSEFQIATHLVLVVVLLLVLLVGMVFSKKPKAPSFQIGLV